ncbi:MAG: flagellar basal body L-ring protein FlgH, partial [Deltaproteobacteria bacterium]|nr:flagellar basal body L-ring protein FlgH [Deltaproteobacteria bacterium]
MMKLFYLWIGIGIILLPAIALSGGIGFVEIPASVSGHLEDQAKELKKGLSFYRYEGSLWGERSSSFYMDDTARRINDVLTIEIDELSNASQQVSTKTSRDSSIIAKITE